MDPGKLCVEIEELPDSTPEFNVTFFLAEKPNVQCPVKIIEEADGMFSVHKMSHVHCTIKDSCVYM